MRSLDSVPLHLVYYFSRQNMVLVPPFYPFQDSSRFLSQCSLPASYISSLYCLLSVRFCFVGRPPPAASGHLSSVRRKSTHIRLTADQCSSPGFLSSVPYESPPPPWPVRLVVLGSVVGGGLWETAPPAMVFSSSTLQQAPPGVACL